jgi:hypothetical protein
LSGCFFLDHVGQVLLSRNHDGLSWKCLDSSDCVRFFSLMAYVFIHSYFLRFIRRNCVR